MAALIIMHSSMTSICSLTVNLVAKHMALSADHQAMKCTLIFTKIVNE